MNMTYLNTPNTVDKVLFASSFTYACEVVTQLVHASINQNIDKILDKNSIDKLEKDKTLIQPDLVTKTHESYASISPKESEKFNLFVEQELKNINEYFNHRFTEKELKGLLVHIKVLITPRAKVHPLMWQDSVHFHYLTELAISSVIECIVHKKICEVAQEPEFLERDLFNDLQKDKTFLSKLIKESKKDLSDFLSLCKNEKNQNEIILINIALEQYVLDIEVYDLFFSDARCLFIYKLPALISKDVPIELIKLICKNSTDYLIKRDSGITYKDGITLTNIDTFLEESYQEILDLGFPHEAFNEWFSGNIIKVIDAFSLRSFIQFKETYGLNDKLNLNQFSIYMLPCGMHDAIITLCKLSYIVNTYSIKSKEKQCFALSSHFINIFPNTVNTPLISVEAIFFNMITKTTNELKENKEQLKDRSLEIRDEFMDSLNWILKVFGIEIDEKIKENALFNAFNLYEHGYVSTLEDKTSDKIIRIIKQQFSDQTSQVLYTTSIGTKSTKKIYKKS
jgi:hypothetical protein